DQTQRADYAAHSRAEEKIKKADTPYFQELQSMSIRRFALAAL
ncbi:hypothetical protein PSYJA_44071, partial [Pseudomonas syringae pv. japonica str. M301072]